MLANEIRNMSVDELLTQEKELKQELFNLKFQKTLGQLQDTAKIRTVKRDIARIKTILTEKTKTDK
ncbi:MAG: 50S ribosomal protein L29 [Leptotrichiaceae bacterium]|jgi:large subunit ribosomal protein L29|nr:50S ribosomal protein L29 [Leptotrichiaceae bacterium]MBP9538813.1 50S ribosomal protein L29 [Leptotrichiaceae bacterium]MBP9876079.1 50S ribosomal protein L29 [Leptotrichiaceae bacterium]